MKQWAISCKSYFKKKEKERKEKKKKKKKENWKAFFTVQ